MATLSKIIVCKHRLKGSTMVEVLAALVIIMVVAGISSMIFLNIIEKPGGMIELEARNQLQVYWAKPLVNSLKDNEWTTDNLTFKQTVSNYENNDMLKLLQIQVYDPKGKLILERKRIVLNYGN